MSDTSVTAAHQGRLVPMVFREGTHAVTAAGDPVNALSFTAMVSINGQDVPIKSGDLLTMAEKGIEFDLVPPGGDPLQLGSLQDLIGWFAGQMGFTAPDWNNLPEALQKITSVVASINKLYVKASKETVQFDIIVTLDFNWNLIGSLVLKSFSFELYRGQAADPPPPPDNNG